MTSFSTRYENETQIIDPFFTKTGTIQCMFLDPKLPRDYLVDFRPANLAEMPPNCFWQFRGKPLVIIERSYDKLPTDYDPTLPQAKGAILFPQHKQKSIFKKKTSERWQTLPGSCRYFTPLSAYWDVANPQEDDKSNFASSEQDWINKVFAGEFTSSLKNLNPVEFGYDLSMQNYEETVTKTKTMDLVKSLKSLHLWALAIMVIGLIMMIVMTAGGN